MSRRLKYNIQNDIHFVTFNTINRIPIFKDKEFCQILIDNLKFYQLKYQLDYYAYVIVPDHVHLLIRFNLDKFKDLTISKIIQGIKSYTAKEIIHYYHQRRQEPPLLSRKGIEQGLYSSQNGKHYNGLKYRIWQPSFWDYDVYSKEHFLEKLNYIHNHPIKHRLTENLADYKFCSWINYEQNNHSIIQINTNFLLE